MGGSDDEGAWGLARTVLRVVAVGVAAVWLVLAVNSFIHGRVVNGLLQVCIAAVLGCWAWTARRADDPPEAAGSIRVVSSPRRAARWCVLMGIATLLLFAIPLFDRDGGAASPAQRTVNFLFVAFILLGVRAQALFRGQELTVTSSLITLRSPRLLRPGVASRQRRVDSIDGMRARRGSVDLLPTRSTKHESWRTRLPGIATRTLPPDEVLAALSTVGIRVD